MFKDMLGQVVRKLVQTPKEQLGILYDLLEKITGSDSETWVRNLKIFLRQEPCWTQLSKLLKHIKSFAVMLDPGKFVACERFKVDTCRKAEVKISYLGDNFREWMLDLVEEQPPTEVNLCCHELLKGSVDGPIIAELGGEKNVETTLSVIFAMMKKQRNRENGILLTNRYVNIFYVRAKGVLCAVHVHWDDGGWYLSAHLVERPRGWDAGDQVFSRNSLSL